MYSIYAALVVFIIAEVALFWWRKRVNSESVVLNFELFFLFNVTTFAFTLMGSLAFSLMLHDYVPTQVVASEAVELVALDSKEGFAGTFVWGSGEIGSNAFLEVWIKNDDGSVSPYRIPKTNSVHVFQETGLQDTGSWKNFYRVEDKDSPLYKWLIKVRDPILVRTELHVPRGTVRTDFKAN